MTNTPLPPNNPYLDAANAYQTSSQHNMSGFEIVVELYKGVMRNTQEAKACYQRGDLEEMVNIIAKTNKILAALQSHLDHDNGGEAAEFLDGFYTRIFGILAAVLRKDDPEAEFDLVLEELEPVYKIWCQHAGQEHAAQGAE